MIDLKLVQIISSAGTDPSDVTDAIWNAGYRKPQRSDSEAGNLALATVAEFYGSWGPQEFCPTTWAEILIGELNDIVIESITADGATAVNVEVAAAGYARTKQ